MTAMTEDTAAPAPQAPVQEPVREAQAAGELLKQLFPALFGRPAKPIQLKVQQAIEARAPGRFTRKALSGFLARHTASTSYLIALTRSSTRFDLDGQPAGEISTEHREAAQAALAERKSRQQERERSMEDARRWRQDLLRDFERTALSRPNFCALKGVEDAQLDALLAQARTEHREGPPPKPNGLMRREGREGRGPRAGQERRGGRGHDGTRPRKPAGPAASQEAARPGRKPDGEAG